jgi:hypothetical protein
MITKLINLLRKKQKEREDGRRVKEILELMRQRSQEV